MEYGDFGLASEGFQQKSGKLNYNLKVTFDWGEFLGLVDLGVIAEDGRKVYIKGIMEYTIEKITEDQLKAIQDDFDPIEAPPGPYKIQPEKQGRIIWLSGAPGMGKSTSAQVLARDHGYVYYEADAFGLMKNPFIDVDAAEASLATTKQRGLKGPGSKERAAMLKRVNSEWGPLMKGEEYNKELIGEFYIEMCKDIRTQRERVGGDWAVANVVYSREIRDKMRELLGDELVFLNLSMEKEDKIKRLLARHGGDEQAVNMFDDYEKVMAAGGDEGDMRSVRVTAEMSREEVVQEIINTLKNNLPRQTS